MDVICNQSCSVRCLPASKSSGKWNLPPSVRHRGCTHGMYMPKLFSAGCYCSMHGSMVLNFLMRSTCGTGHKLKRRALALLPDSRYPGWENVNCVLINMLIIKCSVYSLLWVVSECHVQHKVIWLPIATRMRCGRQQTPMHMMMVHPQPGRLP